MNIKLQQLLIKYVRGPFDDSVFTDIKQLQPGDVDFSDELFNTFEPLERHAIYIAIILWGQRDIEKIFRRRLAVEDDAPSIEVLAEKLDMLTHAPGRRKHISKASRDLPSYKERTPDYQQMLRDAIVQYLSNPKVGNAAQRIMDLEPTDRDFDDKLLDSFTTKDRHEVYITLLLWCGYTYLKRILERRIQLETDPDCKFSISVMLRSLQ